MPDTRTRYPGAQPFSDDELSRKTFFGRERESTELANKVLASRLVVVYAKSGVGKSSLLNAGVAQRLRDQNHLPLSVRVNDMQHGPFVSIVEGIRAAVGRHAIEYVPGRQDSLWHFFKTAEFWKGDLLLTPVLILDQFEELFTLQSAEARADFLTDLGSLVRGVPPVTQADDMASAGANRVSQTDLTDAPPAVRIVLSLREDYLGFLEEAASRIPQILDNRFRLPPLSVELATEAMTGPAKVLDESLRTSPFEYDPEAIAAIVEHLSRRSTARSSQASRYVEPFQLQLVCQRIEQIVAQRQKGASGFITVTMRDIGGEAALNSTLQDFYVQQLDLLANWRQRRAVRVLCEEYLISPEGRRLSLEETEIESRLRVPVDCLRKLVDSRLLRSDQRADSTYYELSHDTLVEPILATTRVSGRFTGLLHVLFGAVLLLIAGILGLIFIAVIVSGTGKVGDFPFAGALMSGGIIVVFPFAWVGVYMLRKGWRTFRRYRSRA